MAPTAKSLVIDLLSAASGIAVPVRELVRACAVFGIRETSVRVAIVRLSAAGSIESAGRGTYRLSGRAQALAREVGSWRTVERRVRTWDDGYLAARFEPPRRGDRTTVRALQLNGFRELERGFAVRPDNLEGSADGVRARLDALDGAAIVFRASDFDPPTQARIFRLWDGKALNASYQRSRARLEKWLDKADRLEPEVAAREAFLLGGEAIRQIVYDPLLPAPFVDPLQRRAFVDSMRTFDRVGRGIWLRLFGVRLGAPDSAHEQGPLDGWSH